MTTETAIAQRSPEPDVHLFARDPAEMQTARADLETFLEGKLRTIDSELLELERANDSATGHRFATSVSTALGNQINRQTRLRAYYEKVLAAVQAGYTIIPSFPLEIFAVRVTKKKPTGYADAVSYKPTIPDELPANAPIGAGEYKSPQQMVRNDSAKERDAENKEVIRYFQEATDYMDVAFPLIAAKAEVLDATAEAMALKVFDQIGICREGRQRGDPLIIGQIRFGKWGDKTASFLIAWHIDLRTL